MGEMPCQRDDQRFPGESRHLYLTVYDKEDKMAFRYVVCPDCYDTFLDEFFSRGYHRNAYGDWALRKDDDKLDDCWQPVDGGRNGRNRPPVGRYGHR